MFCKNKFLLSPGVEILSESACGCVHMHFQAYKIFSLVIGCKRLQNYTQDATDASNEIIMFCSLAYITALQHLNIHSKGLFIRSQLVVIHVVNSV